MLLQHLILHQSTPSTTATSRFTSLTVDAVSTDVFNLTSTLLETLTDLLSSAH